MFVYKLINQIQAFVIYLIRLFWLLVKSKVGNKPINIGKGAYQDIDSRHLNDLNNEDSVLEKITLKITLLKIIKK